MPDQADFHTFMNLKRAERGPAAQNPHLKDWTDHNYKSRATGPATKSEYRARLKGSRLLAWAVLFWLAFWAAVVVLA